MKGRWNQMEERIRWIECVGNRWKIKGGIVGLETMVEATNTGGLELD